MKNKYDDYVYDYSEDDEQYIEYQQEQYQDYEQEDDQWE